MRQQKILDQLRDENFDLAITEPVDGCAYGNVNFNRDINLIMDKT